MTSISSIVHERMDLDLIKKSGSALLKTAGEGLVKSVDYMGKELSKLPYSETIKDGAGLVWNLVKPWLEISATTTAIVFSAISLASLVSAFRGKGCLRRIAPLTLCLLSGSVAILVATNPAALGLSTAALI